MNKKIKYVSRSKTPWSSKKDATPLEVYLTKIYEEHYANHHLKVVESEEANLINSIEIKKCQHCGSSNIKKRGFTKSEIQRYYCNTCNQSFTALTNTIFDNHKISISEWVEFLLYLFGYESINQMSKSNKNSITTTQYWLKKVFLLLKEYQENTILKGTVYLDEMYYIVRKNELHLDEKGRQTRGISQNHICIGVAYDLNKIYCKVQGKSKPSEQTTKDCFINHIQPNSKLIHDKDKTHKILVQLLNLNDVSYDGSKIKKLEDKDNPLTPINKQIDFIRKFLNAHSGFDRNDLQDYLNIYAFMVNEGKAPLEVVERLIQFALNHKIAYKYRTMFTKNSINQK